MTLTDFEQLLQKKRLEKGWVISLDYPNAWTVSIRDKRTNQLLVYTGATSLEALAYLIQNMPIEQWSGYVPLPDDQVTRLTEAEKADTAMTNAQATMTEEEVTKQYEATRNIQWKAYLEEKAEAKKMSDFLRSRNPISRSHEECADCALEKVSPPRCTGHAAGEVHCPQFKSKPYHMGVDLGASKDETVISIVQLNDP